MATYRVGFIGYAHMHVNEIMRRFREVPEFELVACADTVPNVPETSAATFTRAWNLRYAQETIGIAKTYADYRELLDRENLDLVAVYSENSKHLEITSAAAARGINVLIEKPMGISLADAIRVDRVTRAAGVRLFINWLSTWAPSTHTMKTLVDAGTIGRPFQVKARAAHSGPLGSGASHQGVDAGQQPITDADRGRTWWHRAGTGGGALLDFVGNGACLARWWLGEQATAAFGLSANLLSPFSEVEDNAVVTLRFPSAIAVLEASWTTRDPGLPTGPIVYGETGTLAVERRGDEQVVRIGRGAGSEPEYVRCEALPAGHQNIAQEIARCLKSGEPPHPTLTPAYNLEMMAILDAAARSTRTGKLEIVDDSRWCQL
jgi:predicted dehydrogenase